MGRSQPQEPLLTAEDVARHLGVPLGTIYAWRSRGTGPQAMKVGRYLRYRKATVDRWLDGKEQGGRDGRQTKRGGTDG